MERPIGDIELPGLPLFRKGKVRNVFEVDDKLLIVATDRISAFDWVLPSLIPYKGKVLTQLSKFWFDFVGLVLPNHLLATETKDFPPVLAPFADLLAKRSMLVKKTSVVPVECVVRGYLAGSGWKEYKTTGKICGIKIPKGLKESDQLPQPIFTPSTKAEKGHDVNISFKDVQKEIGTALAGKIRKVSLELYQKAALYAVSKGDHHRRHEVRVRPRRRRARPHRRDLHPRLLALLAPGASMSPGGPSRAWTSSSSAITSRRRAGTRTRRRRTCPRRSSPRRPRNTWKSTRLLTGLDDLA